MTNHADVRSDEREPLFMGASVWMIVRYLRPGPRMLIDSLQEAGIKIDRNMHPMFVDP